MKSSLIAGVAIPALLLIGCSTATPPETATAAPPPATQSAQRASPAAAPAAAAPQVSSTEATGARAPSAPASGSTQPSPEALYVYFPPGSASLDGDAAATIDQAARLYREGNPFMMMVAGYTDRTGGEFPNLVLSARRAEAVKKAMVGHGIPPQRLEVQARGESDPKVRTAEGVAAPENRRVVITWR